MKKLRTKFITCGLIMLMLLAVIQIPILGAQDTLVLSIRKDENTYLIYVKGISESEFEFAFSNEENANNLNYISSIKDTKGENIAYVDATLKETFFNGKTSTYIWVKANNKVVVEKAPINIELAKTEEQLQKIENMTNIIKVNSDADEQKIKIEGNASEKYYYKMYPINVSEEYQNLVQLFDEISKFNTDTNNYTKLETYEELEELYTKLVSEVNDSKWAEAENLEIEKPYEAKENQKYILWLKDENGTIDFKILTAYQKVVTEKEETQVVVKVESKLPVTYDNTIVLYIALTIVVIAIIITLIVRKKFSNKNKKD